MLADLELHCKVEQNGYKLDKVLDRLANSENTNPTNIDAAATQECGDKLEPPKIGIPIHVVRVVVFLGMVAMIGAYAWAVLLH